MINLPRKEKIVDFIKEKYPKTRTAEEQAEIVLYLGEKDVCGDGRDDKTLTTSEILDNVPGTTKTHLENLVYKVGLVRKFEPKGNDNFFTHIRRDKNYYSVSEAKSDKEKFFRDFELLLQECRDSKDVKKFVAEELGISPEIRRMKGKLTKGTFQEKVARFDGLVRKLKRSKTELGDYGYGRMGWRSTPHRYQLSEHEVRKLNGTA